MLLRFDTSMVFLAMPQDYTPRPAKIKVSEVMQSIGLKSIQYLHGNDLSGKSDQILPPFALTRIHR
jgi:hypothetical protein